MIEYENECVGCPKDIGCIGSACPNVNVPHLICDECAKETDILYMWDGEELCSDCVLDRFETVTID